MNQNEKPENPNVFPDPMRGAEASIINQSPDNLQQGMTLRDYFAAKAIQGMLSNEKMTELFAKKAEYINYKWENVMSHNAYALADTMLNERQK